MQDATTVRVEKLLAENAALREELRIAETSLNNLRRERAIESRYLKMPNSKLSAPAKAAMIVISREMRAPTKTRERDEEGREHVYRAAIASALGCSDAAAGSHMRKLADAGLIERNTVRTFDFTETYIKLAPLADAPEQVVEPPAGAHLGRQAREGLPTLPRYRPLNTSSSAITVA